MRGGVNVGVHETRSGEGNLCGMGESASKCWCHSLCAIMEDGEVQGHPLGFPLLPRCRLRDRRMG